MRDFKKIYNDSRAKGYSPDVALSRSLSYVVVLGDMDDVRDLHNHYIEDCFRTHENTLKEMEEMFNETNQVVKSKVS